AELADTSERGPKHGEEQVEKAEGGRAHRDYPAFEATIRRHAATSRSPFPRRTKLSAPIASGSQKSKSRKHKAIEIALGWSTPKEISRSASDASAKPIPPGVIEMREKRSEIT